MEDPPLFRWILLVIFLVFSAIFSGSETALTSLSKIKVKNLQEKLGEKGEILSLWLKHPDRLLTRLLTRSHRAYQSPSTLRAGCGGILESLSYVNREGREPCAPTAPAPLSRVQRELTGMREYVILVSYDTPGCLF